MSAKAYMTDEYLDRAYAAERKLRLATVELVTALAWVEHWQKDVQGNLAPTETSLAKVHARISKTLEEIGQ